MENKKTLVVGVRPGIKTKIERSIFVVWTSRRVYSFKTVQLLPFFGQGGSWVQEKVNTV